MKIKNVLMTAIAIFGLATITFAQTVPSYVPTSGLIGWWPFNGNANDESGNGNNGTVNGATLTNDRNGNSNAAYNFDGVSNHIIINNAGILNPNFITISVWFQTISTSASSIIYKTSSLAINEQFACEINYPSQNMVKWAVKYGNNCSNPGVGWQSADVNQNVSDGNWHNITCTYNGSISQIYLDGILMISYNLLPGVIDNCGSNLNIGKAYDSNYHFNGKIDDMAIWDRALTQQEITDLYNGCQLSFITQPTNQTININNNAQFVGSSSDPSATYQWQTDLGVGFQNLNSVGQYSGTTTNSMTVSNVTMSNNNQPFRCIINSGSCSDTSNVAVLTVNNNVGINETSQDKLFSVFPNPAQSIINVKTDSKLIGSDYSIFDNKGRVVHTGKINSENTTIELGNLSSGIYMFSVGENMKQTFKVIKE